MKYGKYEYERSFIVSSDLLRQEAKEVKSITDNYLIGIGLRLRKVQTKTNAKYKLTQKKDEEPMREGVKRINTIYLSEDEYEELNKLPGYRIKKTRHILEMNQQRIGVDVIELRTGKIYLAEVEFETEGEMKAYEVPFSYQEEVTNNRNFGGFELARMHAKLDNY